MYKLEDRILFDGAAVADVADAQQEADSQQEAAQAAEAEEAAQQEAAESADSAEGGEADGSESSEPGSLDAVLAAVNAGSTGSDGQRVDVLLVSDSLENAEDIANATSSGTIVVRYDARTTSAADLLQQITDALDGNLADSIGFATESGENAEVQLFADTDTSLDTVNNSLHQNFFNGLDGLMDEGAQLNLFASNLASTAEGTALVDAIGDVLDHDVAASIDETGAESAGGDWNLEYSTNGVEIDAADTYLDENLIDNFNSLLEDDVNHEVAFINSSVMNVEEILNDLGDNVEIVMLDEGDAFRQITDYLQDKTGIDGIHIISHGNEGFFRLGNNTVDSQFVQEHQADLTTWGHSLTANGDIMIYGCDLAANADGQNLIQTIAAFTGADVAASIDGTGISGDWELEYNVGEIETAAFAVNDYIYNLANITVNNITDNPFGTLGTGIYTLRKAISEAAAGDEIIFATSTVLDPTKPAGSGVADYTIYLNASLGQMEVSKNITINGYITLPNSAWTFAKVDGRSLTTSESLPDDTTNQDFYNSSGDTISVYDNAGTEIDFSTFSAAGNLDVYASNGTTRIAIYDSNGAQLNTITVTNTGTAYDLTVIDTDASAVGGVSNAAARRVMFVNAVSDADNYVTMKNLVIQQGHAVSTGSVIPSDGSGGGMYIDVNSKIVLNEVTVQNSTADVSGGGIYNAGILHIERTSADDITSVSNNTAANSGGGIFNGSTGTLTVLGLDVAHEVWVLSNTATAGSGGGVYSVGDIDARMVWFQTNSALAGSGGAIAIENGGGDSYFYQMETFNNTAYVNGGGISYTQGNNVIIEWSKFSGNVATTGHGGGVYFANNSGDLTIRTTDGTFGANTHAYFSNNTATAGNGGALYVDQSGDLNIDFVEFSDNTSSAASGGAIYMQNSENINIVEGDFDGNDAAVNGGAIYYDGKADGSGVMTITASDIVDGSSVNGGGIYQLAGTLNVINSTLAYNTATTNGGAIYMGDNSALNLSFATVAYNTASATADTGYAIYMTDSAGSSFSSINTIYFNTDAQISTNDQITLGANVTVSSSTYNVYSHYEDARLAGTGNITDPTLIQNTLYLDTVLRRQGNYRTQTLALLYKESVAYTTGTSVSGIDRDQRGNNRIGTDVNGDSNVTPSIGAFEPIYYITVASKGDESALQWSSDADGHYFSEAQEDGITLREAIYWLDNYDQQDAYDAGAGSGALYDINRWVKFDATVFAADADNTILITQGQIEIGFSRYAFGGQTKHIMVSSVANVDPTNNDAINYGNINDTVAFRAQNASDRIIVDGNANDAIFTFSSVATVYLNNITITNGHETNASDGMGGGLRNQGTTILNNIVVSNSVADNTDADSSYTDGGFGGGIYNTGSMQIYDSTITGNNAVAYGSDKYTPARAGLGGGIYNNGTLVMERSSVYNNSVSGQITYVSNESVVGAGIYNTIRTENWITWNSGTGQYDPLVLKTTGSGVLSIANSTIAENTATATQAASDTNPAGSGSAIYMKDGDLNLYYNTIVNNHANLNSGATITDAKAAVAVFGGMDYSFTYDGRTDTYTSNVDLGLSNSILANNTVQVTSSPPVQEYLDLYINNTVAEPTNVTVMNATPIGDYNIIGSYNYDAAEPTAGYDWGVRNNQVGDSFGYVVNLNLDSQLRYNGAKTMTYRLLDGSVAVGTGSAITSSVFTSLATDQRGVSRTMADRSGNIVQNIGAYESLTLLTINSQSDSGIEPTAEGFDFATDKLAWDTTDVSFRDAIYWADTEALITINAASWTSATVTLAKAITISNGITLNGTLSGSAFGNAVLDAGNSYRAFMVDNTDYLPLVDVGLSNMTLKNGNAASTSYSGHGGAIYSKETLTLTSITVQDSTAAGKGGGIFSQTGNLTINQSTISGNTAGTGAGGIYTEANNFTAVESSILSNTTTTGDGGGLYALSSTIDFDTSTIGMNEATAGHGGGLYINSSGFTVLNSTIANNTAGLNGGGITFSGGGTYSINFATIANNISGTANGSQYYGGGIYMGAGNLTISNSVIANNYHYSIAEANRDDFYGTGGVMTSATYNAIGVSTGYVFDVATDNNITYANDPSFFTNLGLDTELTDNGGPTMTLYVFNTDSVLQTNATPNSGATITVDQRGIGRPATGQPTIGAYQKSITEWVYTGTETTVTAAILNDTSNWTLVSGTGPMGTVGATDQTLYFDPTLGGGTGTDNVIITETWNVNYKASVVLDNVAHLTLTGAPSPADPILFTAGLTIMGGSIFTVGSNAAFATASNTSLTLTGSASEIIANNTFSATINITSGTLELNTTDAKLSNLTLGTINAASTIVYGYAGDQTVRTGTYGNLTLSGGGTKTAAGAITVAGTATGLTVSGSTFTLGGTLTSADITLTNGIITGDTYGISSSGDLTATGTSSISGGVISLNDVSSYVGDISGSTVTITDATAITGDISGSTVTIGSTTAATITGDITSSGDLTLSGTTTLAGGTASATSGTITASAALTLNDADLTANAVVLNDTLTTTAGTVGVPKTNTITSSSITMDFAGSSAITVNDYSTLTFDTNAADITINTASGATANTFRANDMTVTTNGSLEFLTRDPGDVDFNGVTGTVADGIAGNLILRGRDINFNGATFNNATLTLGNSRNLNIDSSGFSSANGIIFDGVVNITGTGATITSTSGSLTFNQNIIGNGNDFNLTASSSSITVTSVTGAGALVVSAGTTATISDVAGTSLTVTATNGIALNGTINMTGAVDFNNAVSVASGATASVTGSAIDIGGAVTGLGDLTLARTGTGTTTFAGGVNMTGGNLTLSDGGFDTGAAISSAGLNIESLATLAMGGQTLTSSGSLTNAGALTSTTTITAGTNITNTGSLITTGAAEATSGYINNSGTFSANSATTGGDLINASSFTATTTATVGGNLTNTSSFTATTATVTGDITNSGSTFTVPTVNASGNITNTGTMTISSALNLNGTGTSILSMGGDLSTSVLTVANNKDANLTNGTITVTTFTFTGATSTSKFALASGTNLYATNIIDTVAADYYDGAYFDTAGGGQLVRTMTGSEVEYRVGNSTSATVITLNTTAGEKIAAHVLDSVKFNGGIVTGIQDTAEFTTFLERDWGGTSGTNPIAVTENWSTVLEGANFDPATSTNLFVLSGSWSDGENITVTFTSPVSGRRGASYTLPHNGTYAFANAGANMTIPITDLNGNIALFEMSNPDFDSMYGDLDSDILSNFPIGTYPYFSSDRYVTLANAQSVGKSVYRQMEYRLAANPLTNPLIGQVPPIGSVVGQAITEGASLNLTSDAPVYLEVNGENSVGAGWLPISEPASAGNIEQYQAPITQGQIDQFYIDFGGREGIFEKPVSFRSGLDEMLDDLLAG